MMAALQVMHKPNSMGSHSSKLILFLLLPIQTLHTSIWHHTSRRLISQLTVSWLIWPLSLWKEQQLILTRTDTYSDMRLPFFPAGIQPAPLCWGVQGIWPTDMASHITAPNHRAHFLAQEVQQGAHDHGIQCSVICHLTHKLSAW